MDYLELLEKYNALLIENRYLRDQLKKFQTINNLQQNQSVTENSAIYEETESNQQTPEHSDSVLIDNHAEPIVKIKFFLSLFKGRSDIYAKRWENIKKGTCGYAPFCLNEWKPGICKKGKSTCTTCTNKLYGPLNETVIDNHLRGRENIVIGIYPLCPDETCHFLAIDFDGNEWQKDIGTIRNICSQFDIPVAIERSRSGMGAHAWFFFTVPVAATDARKFGSAILTFSMDRRHDITFKSYDRLFPNQDTMPKGGFGNLIALPLQKAARNNNNSVFIDENFHHYEDQWAFLTKIKKLSLNDIKSLTLTLTHGKEMGELKDETQDKEKPWEIKPDKHLKIDCPSTITIIKAAMLFIPKKNIPEKTLNYLKRLAAFKNPEFFKAQALRLSVKKIPRIISCSDETPEYLCLPRGCEPDLKLVFDSNKIDVQFIDKTNHGKQINVQFNGTLRDEQPVAFEKMSFFDNGVLSGTTAFGKTVVAINLIAEKKVNTLILVDKISLVSQWRNKLSEFLIIKESLPETISLYHTKRKGKERNIIGQLGAGKNELYGIIDIAVIQSLNRMGTIHDCVSKYGMIIVDECHHVSAFSFEQILKNVNAKYVYGLTATPTRKDGHHPIIFMQCGPVRFKDNAIRQAQKRPFEHFVIPRFTSLHIPCNRDGKDISINDLYNDICTDELRNQLIIGDIISSHENRRNSIVLTQRISHVEFFVNELQRRIPNVIPITGGMGLKETRETFTRITAIPPHECFTLIATGKYIGEGFDEPRLDTLFLTMPVSWKGTLQQYAGRLHRLFENKNEVLIYDYVDIHIHMLEKMYQKRLSGYAAMGYKTKSESNTIEPIDIIFDKSSFLPVYFCDIENASKEIIIVSPFVTRNRCLLMMQNLKTALDKNVKITIVTRPIDDFKNKDCLSLKRTLDLLLNSGISLSFKSNIHQKFAIIDQKIVWFGSINLLSFGSSEESIMRLENQSIAAELLRSFEKITVGINYTP